MSESIFFGIDFCSISSKVENKDFFPYYSHNNYLNITKPGINNHVT